MNPPYLLRCIALQISQTPAPMTGTQVMADYAAFDSQAAGIGASLQARGIVDLDPWRGFGRQSFRMRLFWRRRQFKSFSQSQEKLSKPVVARNFSQQFG